MSERAQALFYTSPGQAELRPVALPPMAEGMVQVRTLFSGISRGTERLVSTGQVPPAEFDRMRAPFQEGDFPFPVKYGYAATGVVEAGPDDLIGAHVFALHPHQSRFRVNAEDVVELPEGVPPGRAVLGANAETALNAIWDASDLPTGRILVLGAGLLGCLIAAFLSRIHSDVDLTDKISNPGATVADFPVNCVSSEGLAPGYALIFNTTGAPEALQKALDLLAFEGRVIELSWFGTKPVNLMLGGSFHANRLTIQSSQVGHVAPARRATTTHRDRLADALQRLADPRFDRLITEEVPFSELPNQINRLLGPRPAGIATRVRY